ncbi:MAG TPA: FeS assembly protein [Verrucomicrobiales bacterium]|jgi:NifU-like protein involved in Fe-S cluster formation|nr:FeS assembly protein [Verrucomicrobiales bacterium]HIL69197.1 FeS assembly protein [Verrucomicrobiota bacterium]
MDQQEFENKVREVLKDTENRGELADADVSGAVGSAGCGDIMQMWIKFKEENGRRVIDKASFQSFGCETAVAVAGLASKMILGKTAEEAINLSGEELAPELGALPPMKIHCSELVEQTLRSALESELPEGCGALEATEPKTEKPTQEPSGTTLLEKFSNSSEGASPRIVFLDEEDNSGS